MPETGGQLPIWIRGLGFCFVALAVLVLAGHLLHPTHYELRIDFEETEPRSLGLYLVQSRLWGFGGETECPVRRSADGWEYQDKGQWHQLSSGSKSGEAVNRNRDTSWGDRES
jgi:hypothetical protein